jgi:hypothetical protein
MKASCDANDGCYSSSISLTKIEGVFYGGWTYPPFQIPEMSSAAATPTFTTPPPTPFTLPPGTYAIGSLETALSACQEYHAFLKQSTSTSVFFQSEDKVLFLAPTRSGNSIYTDSNGKSYPVTNELFGMISMPYLATLAKNADLDQYSLLYGLHKYTFDTPVNVDIQDGHFSFSSMDTCVEIETAIDDELSSIYYSESSEEEE